jgi:hypothetical protein
MMNKIILALLILIAVAVSGCASQSPANNSAYKPAKNSGFGYKETLLGPNNYRVQFKSSGSTRKAQDFALLRAAELTTENGYDWFVVNKRDLDSDANKKSLGSDFNTRQPTIERDCGLLGCTNRVTSGRAQTFPDIDSDLDETPFPEVKVILEITFGKGVRPSTKNTYDALETQEKLRIK